jgi:hypothetical protein
MKVLPSAQQYAGPLVFHQGAGHEKLNTDGSDPLPAVAVAFLVPHPWLDVSSQSPQLPVRQPLLQLQRQLPHLPQYCQC